MGSGWCRGGLTWCVAGGRQIDSYNSHHAGGTCPRHRLGHGSNNNHEIAVSLQGTEGEYTRKHDLLPGVQL